MNIRALKLVCCLVLIAPISAIAAGGVVNGPNEIAPDRYVYYPGTEVLAEDEIRIIACGTGMPDQRLGRNLQATSTATGYTRSNERLYKER